MQHTASIPAWVARRGWSRRNRVWVRLWLDRKPKGNRSAAEPTEPQVASATILPFSREQNRTEPTPRRQRAQDR
ncbi:hypothetical protein MKK68_03160 [Methylobacterium sp. E-016]|nr:hypothetical protein [Methylobacterium sp. E-016]